VGVKARAIDEREEMRKSELIFESMMRTGGVSRPQIPTRTVLKL
jgi:hypothetical protein